MSTSGISFLIGYALVFLAERMFGTNDTVRFALLGLGGVLILGGFVLRLRTMAAHPAATRASLLFQGVSLLSLVVYGVSSRDMLSETFGFAGDSLDHARTLLSSAIPLLFVIGALPTLSIDRTLSASPRSVHPRRLGTAVEGGLVLAFGLAMLFPLNWLAQEYNKRFDYSFFKTTGVGDSTRSIVDNLTEPVRVVLFFPTSNEVLREIEPYFDELEGPNLTVEVKIGRAHV